MTNSRARFTYANIMATVAVVLSLGVSTSYAVAQLPKNSVGSTQVKNKSLKTADLAKGTVAKLKKPRAYGVFRSAGALVPARSKGVTTHELPGTGLYCVQPTKSTGIKPTKTTIIATADWDDGPGSTHLVQILEATRSDTSGDCPGGFILYTKTFDSPSSDWLPADIAVSFVIP